MKSEEKKIVLETEDRDVSEEKEKDGKKGRPNYMAGVLILIAMIILTLVLPFPVGIVLDIFVFFFLFWWGIAICNKSDPDKYPVKKEEKSSEEA